MRNAKSALSPRSNDMRHAMAGTRPISNVRISHWDQSAMGMETHYIIPHLTSCGHVFVICVLCSFMGGPYHYHSPLCGLYAIQCRLHLVEAVSVHVDCVFFCVYALTLNVRVNDTYAV